MKQAVPEFGWDGITNIAVAQFGAWFSFSSILRIRVAALDHKILYYAVKQGAVVKALFCQLNKIVAVLLSFIVKPDDTLAISGFYTYILIHRPAGKRGRKCK